LAGFASAGDSGKRPVFTLVPASRSRTCTGLKAEVRQRKCEREWRNKQRFGGKE
jgi:hypothetical protein